MVLPMLLRQSAAKPLAIARCSSSGLPKHVPSCPGVGVASSMRRSRVGPNLSSPPTYRSRDFLDQPPACRARCFSRARSELSDASSASSPESSKWCASDFSSIPKRETARRDRSPSASITSSCGFRPIFSQKSSSSTFTSPPAPEETKVALEKVLPASAIDCCFTCVERSRIESMSASLKRAAASPPASSSWKTWYAPCLSNESISLAESLSARPPPPGSPLEGPAIPPSTA
mmetsp:Transcript_42744/g.105361  ORF Transcript_42744/g.105361 Transcript_42744/m.105361 type:complete len:232 (+) Transcript_42744:1594-2289(+)